MNVLIGYPNVGKSNILEALSLFQIGNIADIDVRSFLRFENYVNLFYNNSFSNNILVKLDDTEKIEIKLKNKQLHIKSESKKMFFEVEVPLNNYWINAMEHVSKTSDDYDALERIQIKKYSFHGNQKEQSLGLSRELNSPYGENIADVINVHEDLKKDIIGIFKDYNLKYGTDENNKIRIVKEYENQEVKIFPYIQIADTIQRLIFYKASIFSNNNSVLLFEEPEAHMFPPYISKFTTDIIFDKNNNQYFITTHSPFVVNEFIEEIQNELSVYVVDYDKGETIIKRLTDEELTEIAQFGIDLFFNLEAYLDKYGQPHST
ncbi:MAG TPA: AAA family ATPase [Parafilimonas sp.]|nr:AAA family ATPase [Parafilimonas sp.]